VALEIVRKRKSPKAAWKQTKVCADFSEDFLFLGVFCLVGLLAWESFEVDFPWRTTPNVSISLLLVKEHENAPKSL
jgi:hypothetical protein